MSSLVGMFFVLDDAGRTYPLMNHHMPWVLAFIVGILTGLYFL